MADKFRTKQERRAREELLRTLGREFKKAVFEMANSYLYSGTPNSYRMNELQAILDRIAEVYLQDKDT